MQGVTLFSLLLLVTYAAAYSSRVNICLCSDEEGEHCALLPGFHRGGDFLLVGDNGEEVIIPASALKNNVYPREYCAGKQVDVDRRWLIKGFGGGVHHEAHVNEKGETSSSVSAEVHLGPVDVKGHVDLNEKGDVSGGGVGAKVNVEGVEVGGQVGVDKDGHVSTGTSVGLGAGPLGSVDIHVHTGPDGVKTGVGAHVDVGTVHGSATVDVDQNGKVSQGAGLTVDKDLLGKRAIVNAE